MAWPVGGTCAAVISHPTEKQKHSIRIFPINNWLFDLVKHLFKRGYFAESIEKTFGLVTGLIFTLLSSYQQTV